MRSVHGTYIIDAGSWRACHLKTSTVERDATGVGKAAQVVLAEAGLPVMPGDTHIVPPIVGDPVKAKKVSEVLLAE